MIGIHLLARAGKAGVYFALTILVVAIDLLLSVLVGPSSRFLGGRSSLYSRFRV